MVIQALVLSGLTYCAPVLASVSETCSKKLQVIQNKACRLALKCPFDTPVVKMHSDLGWLSVRNRLNSSTLKLFVKVTITGEPQKIYQSLVPCRASHRYSTRQSLYNYSLAKPRNNCGKRSSLTDL